MFSDEEKLIFLKNNIDKEIYIKFDYELYDKDKDDSRFWGLGFSFMNRYFLDGKTFVKIKLNDFNSDSIYFYHKDGGVFYMGSSIIPYLTIKEMIPKYIQEELEI